MIKEYLVADIGCGPNPPEDDPYNSTITTIGVDINRDNLKGFISGGNGNAVGVQADIRRLPFKQESINKVRARHVLEHMEEPEESLGEINRVLKKGAGLEVAVPHHRVDGLVRFLNNKYRDMHKCRFTPQDIKKLVGFAGFNIENMGKKGWLKAVGLIGLTFWNMFSSNHEFVDHAGIKADDPTSNKLRTKFYRVGGILEKIPGLNTVMNRILPNETVIRANKL